MNNTLGICVARASTGALMCALLATSGCKDSRHNTARAGLPPAIYEAFDYVLDQPAIGEAGGIGLGRPWNRGGFNARTAQNYKVCDGSLEYPNLLVSGRHVSSTSQPVITGLARPLGYLIGVDGTRRYLSFLLRPEGTLQEGVYNGFFGLSLKSSSDTVYHWAATDSLAARRANSRGRELFVGKPGGGKINTFVLEERGGANQISSGVPVKVGQTALLVVRMDFSGTNDTFTLFVNPAVGQPEPTNGVTETNIDLGIVDRLVLYSTGAFSIDEIRVGDTYASVTPVSR